MVRKLLQANFLNFINVKGMEIGSLIITQQSHDSPKQICQYQITFYGENFTVENLFIHLLVQENKFQNPLIF